VQGKRRGSKLSLMKPTRIADPFGPCHAPNRNSLKNWRPAFLVLLVIPSLFAAKASPQTSPSNTPQSGSALAIPGDRQIEPEELHRPLQASDRPAPLVLQVGSHMLYTEAHIPGAEYVGPASQPAGLAMLRHRVESVPRDRAIVLYCGCCPWNRCPNIAPALQLLREMGFTNAKVLHIDQNFGADWVRKGYGADSAQ
jgi:thiosulfate/3-mercaptopyruvate sulfurtransferase